MADPKLKEIHSGTVSKIRYLVEKTLEHRKPKVVMIDEGQHLTIVSSARKLLDHQNIVKSVANRTKTTHILFGNYDLLFLRNLNGQLARRTCDIHFSRYDFEKTEDLNAFKNIIWMFQNNIPVKKTPNLLSSWEYIYERSVGCIGIMKDWLDRAFKKMLEENEDVFLLRHLESSALPIIKIQKIAEEIVAAEEKLLMEQATLKDLRLLLKMNKSVIKKKNTVKDKPIKKSKDVGLRSVTRDPVGIENSKHNEQSK